MRQLAAGLGPTLPIDAPPERPTRVRNSRRALAWREQLERTAGHALSMAKTKAEQDAVAEAHAAEVRVGPDWVKVRRGSIAGVPVACKDRNALDRLLRWFALLERETHAADKAWARHERRVIRRTIPRTARAVLLALVALSKRYSSVFPSIERLASMAQCCRRTVVMVLNVLEHLGLVKRIRRRKIVQGPFGLRVVQTTNCYIVTIPAGASAGQRRPRPAEIEKQAEKANSSQQSAIQQVQSRKEFRVVGAVPVKWGPNRTYDGPTKGFDWRLGARALLAKARS